MSTRPDAEHRRIAIAEAVFAIAARDGLAAASVRDIAAEAGVSAGMVQHHFRTQEETLAYAANLLVGRMLERLSTSLPDDADARTVLRALLVGSLPDTAARAREIRIWIGFLARAAVQPQIAGLLVRIHTASHEAIRAWIVRAIDAGDLAAAVDADQATMTLFAMSEGLVSHVLLGHYTPEDARRTIDHALDALFGSS